MCGGKDEFRRAFELSCGDVPGERVLGVVFGDTIDEAFHYGYGVWAPKLLNDGNKGEPVGISLWLVEICNKPKRERLQRNVIISGAQRSWVDKDGDSS